MSRLKNDDLGTDVRRAFAITVRAGLISTPMDANPSLTQAAVVVPEPLHGSSTREDHPSIIEMRRGDRVHEGLGKAGIVGIPVALLRGRWLLGGYESQRSGWVSTGCTHG